MERFNSEPQFSPERDESMEIGERKEKLASEIRSLHEQWSSRWPKIFDESEGIRNKRDKTDQDNERLVQLREEQEVLSRKARELTKEVLNLFSQDHDAKWTKYPSTGVPGSIARINTAHYRTPIGGNYEFEVMWGNMPTTENFRPESYRERYRAEIRDKTHKPMARNPLVRAYRKITTLESLPMMGLSTQADENGEFHASSETVRSEQFDDEAMKVVGEQLLTLGKRLHEELGDYREGGGE